ncbi:hypothetical protein [Flavobacterium panici]|uniref:HNH endonuclease n=1 Tax=Flavobacterium panici TaxID=2654843 RepID=A0A9N8P0B9_9FLAO|nr:hypothetical protein [Flavobacterium panici]CAC9972886.1 hypothetical protein FLAPXU55_00565 [Flavobacterium panici]
MNIESKLLEIRKTARGQGKYVMNKLFDDYLTGLITKKKIPSCSFCGTEKNLTKEHVIPKWVFESNPKKFFVSDVNKLDQSYIKATIPLCAKCNSELFNSIERKVQKILSVVDLKKSYYSPDDWLTIIRWLEIIDFKIQVWDLRSEFKKHKDSHYIPMLADLSIAYMRDFSVRTVTTQTRKALKRIATKDKSKRISHLIVGTTKNTSFHYFHTSGDFIFLEIPQYNKIFFYFYEREYKNEKIVSREAMKIIESVYSD